MFLGYLLRFGSVLAQIGSVALIVEGADTSVAAIYFSQLSLSLVLGMIGTFAFPVYSFPFVRRGKGAEAIAAAINIQLGSFWVFSSVMATACWLQDTPVSSGLGLYLATVINQNHFFHRHYIVARNLPRMAILAYESVLAFVFLSFVTVAVLLGELGLPILISASIVSALSGWLVGAMVSKSLHDWARAIKILLRVTSINPGAIYRHTRRAFPTLMGQITQSTAYNFPVFAASIFSNATAVVALALMQRLLGVVQTLGWLQVVTLLHLYFVERAPRRGLRIVFPTVAGVVLMAGAGGLLCQISAVEGLLRQMLPQASEALIMLSHELPVYILPGFILVGLHLEQIYLGAHRNRDLLTARLMALAAMALAFSVLYFLLSVDLVASVLSAYSMYFIGQVFWAVVVNGEVLNLRRKRL